MVVLKSIPATVRLLLVEDSPAMQEVLQAILSTMGWVRLVGVAETSAEAIRCFEETRPDLVIVDLLLREGSGFEVLNHIRAGESACRVLVFTSHDSEPFRSRCLQAGADGFYSKSRQHRELVEALHNHRS